MAAHPKTKSNRPPARAQGQPQLADDDWEGFLELTQVVVKASPEYLRPVDTLHVSVVDSGTEHTVYETEGGVIDFDTVTFVKATNIRLGCATQVRPQVTTPPHPSPSLFEQSQAITTPSHPVTALLLV